MWTSFKCSTLVKLVFNKLNYKPPTLAKTINPLESHTNKYGIDDLLVHKQDPPALSWRHQRGPAGVTQQYTLAMELHLPVIAGLGRRRLGVGTASKLPLSVCLGAKPSKKYITLCVAAIPIFHNLRELLSLSSLLKKF